MKALKSVIGVLCIVSLFVISCGGGGGGGDYSYDTCIDKATKAAMSQGVPEDAAKQVAPNSCLPCKDDANSAACKTLIDNL